MGVNSDGRISSNVIRDLRKSFLAKTEYFTREKADVKCWKFMDCPQEIMNVCPAVLHNSERWWLASESLSGLKDRAPRPVVSCTQCDFYRAAKHMYDEKFGRITA
ncbi:MAG: hypothetical protein HQK96_01395 [Nitrospirae bacterium]|nr:hypothetical protein [Nitrospirota bacterium]